MSEQTVFSGRLAARAIDLKNQKDEFDSHTNGSALNHEAAQIDLSPTITIDGYESDNVRSALDKLNTFVATFGDATTSVKGIVKLAGDLGGTADLPTVTRVTGDSGTTSVELDQVNLYFTNVAGTAHKIAFKGSNSLGNPGTLTIQGQQARLNLFSDVNGGDVIILGGLRNTLRSSSRNGKAFIKTQTGEVIVVKETGVSANILALFNDVSSTDYPGSVDKTIYIRNASTDPVALPLSGSVLYSRSGKIKVKHGNGDNFAMGDHPSAWTANVTTNLGITSGAYFEAKSVVSGATAETISSYSFGNNEGVILVEVELVGITTSPSVGYAGYKMVSTLKISGGTIATIGSVTFLDSKESGDAVSWTAPTISSSVPYQIDVISGFSPSAHSIDWFATVKFVAVESA